VTQLWPTDTQRKSTKAAAWSASLLLISFALTIVFGLSTSEPVLKPYPTYPRPAFVPSFDPISAVQLGLLPAPLDDKQQPRQTVRALFVYPTGVVQYLGGAPYKSVTSKEANDTSTLINIARLVNDKRWIEVQGATVTLHTALILTVGSALSITSPLVDHVKLDPASGSFIAASGGSVSISGVTVSGPAISPGTPSAPKFRPFILMNGPVQLHVDHSRFENLGWDWNDSYGFSVIGAVKGEITTSVFTGGFFGIYTQMVDGLTISDSTFEYNVVYGIDPHTGSSNLQILRNTARFNGAHGIIVSQDVTDSTIANNTSTHNGEDGIVVDEGSNRTTVRNNVVAHNTGDGIVVTSSKSTSVLGNVVRKNRIGIRLSGDSSAKIEGNTFVGNVIPAQGIEVSRSLNRVGKDNNVKIVPPPSWHIVINVVLWPATIVATILALVFRRRERREFKNYRFSNDPSLQPKAN